MHDALGLYLSIPFCRSKCSYCNFASGVYPVSSMARYVDRLIDDLRSARDWGQRNGALLPAKVDSIYFGGGTPSLLPPALLWQLFAAIRSEFEFLPDTEITVECAPGQIEDEVLLAMLQAGVNRVSFGVQSFVDREAALTGRLHNREISLADISRMQRAGIAAINVDLIAGLPHQTADSWQESLEMVAATGVSHGSVYMLEVDEDSRLGRELLAGGGRYHAAAVPSEDLVAELYQTASEHFAQEGLQQYEISNFARENAASRHNLKYWRRQPYIGLGVDAHSMLRTVSNEVVRFSVTENLQHFLDGNFDPETIRVSPTAQLEEAWFLGLRLNRGVLVNELCREFGGVAVAAYDGVLDELLELKMLEIDAGRVRLTAQGRLLSNEVFERFLLAEARESSEELICVS